MIVLVTTTNQIVMENRTFLVFVDELYRRDDLPVWKDAAELVAALAAFHQLHHLKVKIRRNLFSSVYLFLVSDASR